MFQWDYKVTNSINWVNLFKTNVSHQIETSQLICTIKGLTGFNKMVVKVKLKYWYEPQQ